MNQSNVDRARAWLRNTPGAVTGQNGHGATFAVATSLVHGFELSHGDAEALFNEYNAKCVPPWKPHELAHKLVEASKVAHDKPRGWLLSAQSGTPVSTTGKFIVKRPTQPVPVPAKESDVRRALLKCSNQGNSFRSGRAKRNATIAGIRRIPYEKYFLKSSLCDIFSACKVLPVYMNLAKRTENA